MKLIDVDELRKVVTIKGTIEIIDNAQTVEAVKHAEWTNVDVYDICGGRAEMRAARCSNCGKYHTAPYFYHFDMYAYCPWCGAKMEGGTNGK